MKTFLLALLFALNFVLAHAQQPAERGTLDYLSDKYGFRDATFEKPLAAFNGLHLIRTTSDGEKVYSRTTDKLAIGEYRVAAIEYQFYRSLLSSVHIIVEGKKNVEGVFLTMSGNYGVPEGEDGGGNYEWNGTRVKMVCRTYNSLQKGLFVMMSGPMLNRKIEDEEAAKAHIIDKKAKAAKAAASDL